MPKAKPVPAKKTTTRKSTSKTVRTAKPKIVKTEKYSAEYREYLERYAIYGEGRPRLSPADFDKYDDELLDLLGQEMERGLDDDQIIRVKELEYLLLDPEQ